MAVNTQLGAPSPNDQVRGKCTHVRFVRCEASAAAPVTAITLSGVQSWNVGDPSPDYSEKIFQQGGGDEYYMKESGYTTSVTIDFLKGQAWTQFAALNGITFSTSDSAGIPMVKQNDYPKFTLEAIIRRDDNNTHVGSVIVPDVVIDSIAWDHPLDTSMFQVKGHTRRSPISVCTGAELVYDVFTGDGSTTDFTLSSTPLTVETATNWDVLDYDKFIYIKEKASTASTGTLKRTGYSAVTTTLSAATAPAAGTLVQVLYLKATA